MVDEFFRGTFMEDTGLTMGADADQVHIVHLVKMNNAIFHIFIGEDMAFVFTDCIHIRILFHQEPYLHRFLCLVPGDDLQQVNRWVKSFDQFLQEL